MRSNDEIGMPQKYVDEPGSNAAKVVHTKGCLSSVLPLFYADVREMFFIILSSVSGKSIVA